MNRVALLHFGEAVFRKANRLNEIVLSNASEDFGKVVLSEERPLAKSY